MKRIIFLILFFMNLSPAFAAAGVSTPQPVAAGVNQASRQEFYQRWSGIKKELDAKNFEGARSDLMELQGRCSDLGISSFEELSAAMVKEGKTLLNSNDTKGALLVFDFAARLSPSYPAPYYAKGWGYLKQDKLKALLTLDSFIEGFRNSLDDFWWVFYYAGNKFASLLFTLAALFSLYGLFIAIRYMPLLAHDLSELLKKKQLEKALKYAILPASLLLVLIMLGYWWAVTATFLALWVYFNRREKAAAIVFFVLLTFMPEIMGYFADFVQAGGNKLLWVMDNANKGTVTRRSEDYLREVLKQEPGNKDALFALASTLKKEGNYSEAGDLYGRLLSMDPKSAIYLNNLGNINFLANNPDQAIKDYNAAIELDRKQVLPYFNLSQVYAENLMFTEREKADLEARELDPDLVARLRDIPGNTPLRMVFDEKLPTSAFWRIAFKEKDPALAELFWATTVKVLPLKGTRLAGICFVILVLALNAFRKKGIYSHFCRKCGKVSCRKCQKPYYSRDLCPQCHQMFVKLDGVEAKDRVRKMLEIREAQRKQGLLFRICSLFLPGSGQFLLGHPLRGFVFLGGFIFLVKDVFFGPFFQVPYDFNLPFIRPDSIMLAGILVSLYVIAQIDMHKLTK